mmetsp:Transcript_1223/g.2178  ORF Transcript_1223/g.2178 Transcript_1223/m.2178 type:complete len:135 (-) Transcript_1223:1162-1566(-)
MTKRMTEGRKLQWCGDVNVTYMVHVWAQKSRQQSKRSERVKNKEEKPRHTWKVFHLHLIRQRGGAGGGGGKEGRIGVVDRAKCILLPKLNVVNDSLYMCMYYFNNTLQYGKDNKQNGMLVVIQSNLVQMLVSAS